MEIPLLDLKAQYATIRDEVRAAIDRVLESQYFILGPEVEALEQEIAAYSQCKQGIGVSSGTDALLVSLMAIDIKPGDEVITTPFTFFATAGCIARLGAKPKFVDIDPITFNLDPAQIEAVITGRTRAIIPVHLYGQMAEMDSIMDIARRHHLHVIEDAAQAIGAEYKERRAGSIGHLGCLSFFPSKNLGGFGDGGMVVTNDAHLADRIKLLRNHGYRPKYYNKILGGNFRLDAIQAAALRVKLKYLGQWTLARQRNAATYRKLFSSRDPLWVDVVTNKSDDVIMPHKGAGLRNQPNSAQAINAEDRDMFATEKGVMLPQEAPQRRHIYNQFVIRIGNNKRDGLKAHLKQMGIETEIYYPAPMHLQECFVDLRYRIGAFPQSENAAAQTLALPIYPEMTEKMLTHVVEAIASFQ